MNRIFGPVDKNGEGQTQLPRKVAIIIAVILGIPVSFLILIVLYMILMQFFPSIAPR